MGAHRGVLWIACCVVGLLAFAPGEASAAPPRPDLAITSVQTNRVSLVGRPFYVTATVVERSRRVGARAQITVTANKLPLTTRNIVLRPGRRLVVKLPVTLTALG